MASAALLEQAGGYALIYRRIIDNPVFRNPGEAMAFGYLILMASWRPARVRYKQRQLILERGQVAMSVRDFATAMDRSKDWAQRFLDRLEDAGMIVRKPRQHRDSAETPTETGGATAPNVITICNYDKYQASSEIVATVDGTVGETGGATGGATQNKEEKEGKKYKTPSVSPPSRKTAWVDGKAIPEEWIEWAITNMGWTRGQALGEAVKMVDNAVAHRRLYVDWMAAWRNWCRSPFQKTVASKQEALGL